jgi:hypothetical protein
MRDSNIIINKYLLCIQGKIQYNCMAYYTKYLKMLTSLLKLEIFAFLTKNHNLILSSR